jgi:hypothetical protein
MGVGTFFNYEVKHLDKGLNDDGVEELLSKGKLFLITEARVVVVVVTLISKLVKKVRICELIHSSVIPMDKGLLVDLVTNVHKDLIVVADERIDICKEWI